MPFPNQYLSGLSDADVAAIVENISHERLVTYLQVTADDREALMSNQINGKLSKHIFEIICGFEVAWRNRVSESVAEYYRGDDWFRCRKFVMNLTGMHRGNIREVRKRLKAFGQCERPGRVIAGLTFHFWTAMHENKYRDTIWVPHLRKISPKGENLKQVHKSLLKTRDLRNRITHHEPIFHERWHMRFDEIWNRFAQISPEKTAWYRSRLNAKVTA